MLKFVNRLILPLRRFFHIRFYEVDLSSINYPRLNQHIIPLLLLLLPVIGLWVVTGLDFGPYRETWTFYHWIDENIANNEPCLTSFGGRPLLLVGFCIGNWLTPNSFVGINLLLMAVLWLKSLAAYAIARHLVPQSQLFAISVGLLTNLLVFDPLQTHLVGLHYNPPIMFLLWAIYFLLYQHRSSRLWPLVVFPVLLALSLLMYETGIVIIAVAPLLLLLDTKLRSVRFWRLTALWYITPLLVFLLVTRTGYVGNGYQTRLIDSDLSPIVVVGRIFDGFFHQVGLGYFSLQHLMTIEPTDYLLGFMVAASTLVFISQLSEDPLVDPNSLRFLATIGSLLVLAGFFPFVVSNAFEGADRVYLFSGFGTALVWSSVAVVWLRGYSKIGHQLAITLVAVLVFIGFVTQVGFRRTNFRTSIQQQSLIGSIVSYLPSIPNDVQVVIVDDVPFAHVRQLTYATRYVYPDNDIVMLECTPHTHFLRSSCQFLDNGLLVILSRQTGIATGAKFNPQPDNTLHRLIPYESLILFRLNGPHAELVRDIGDLSPQGSASYRPHEILDMTDIHTSLRLSAVMQDFTTRQGIVRGDAIEIGSGWFNEAIQDSRKWRWLNNDGELILRPTASQATLRMFVEPGPSLIDRNSVSVQIVNEVGTPLAQDSVTGTTGWLRFELELQPHQGNVVRVEVLGSSNAGVSEQDPRILNLRVFEIQLVE